MFPRHTAFLFRTIVSFTLSISTNRLFHNSLTTKFEALTKADTKKTSGSGPLKSRLKICSHGSTGRNDATPASSSEGQSELESEELNELMKEINDTTTFILHKAEEHEANEQSSSSSTQTLSVESADEESLHDCNSERFYVERMSDLQFGTFSLLKFILLRLILSIVDFFSENNSSTQ